MSRLLGFRQKTGAISNDGTNPYGNGFWVAAFDPAVLAMGQNDFEVYRMALQGPTGSRLQVWVDRTFYDNTNHGDINSWDPNNPLVMNGGSTLYLYWNLGAAPAPLVTIWLRRVSPF